MGRPPTKTRFLTERIALAKLIDAALTKGQRATGEKGQPWTNMGFAEKIGASASSVAEWRDTANPARPGNIVPLLNAFFGTIPAYADDKAAMLKAWKRAGGIDSDDPPDPRAIQAEQFSEVAQVVSLLINQPTPDNQGNLKVPYTLHLRCHESLAIPIVVNKRPVTVTLDIGLTAPLFAVESKHWNPVQDSIFRKRKHPNLANPFNDSVRLIGPTDNHSRIVGEPLEDETHVLMEPSGAAQDDGPITLLVKSPRDGISVTLADGAELSATQRDVIDALFASAIPRDAANRLEVARATISPKAGKPSQ